MQFLKQSTAVTLKIGPFLDETNGKDAETALTLSQADVRLSKNGGDIAQKNEATSCTHDELGVYGCPIDATDTNTLGRLQLWVHESGALPVWHEYMVITANEYDSICSTDYKEVDVLQVGGATQSATDLKDFADTGYDPTAHKVQGVVLTDTATAITNTVNLSAASEAQIDAIETDTNEIQGKLPTNNLMGSSVKTDKDDEIDAIKAKTDNLPADPADDSDIDAQLATIAGYIDTEIAAIKAITDLLTLANIADAVLDEVVDTNNPAAANSLREVINVMSAILAGKSSGGGTNTLTFRNLGDTKNRQTETVDADGNRTAVTPDGT